MVKYGFNIRFNHLLIHTAVLRSTSTVVTVMYSNQHLSLDKLLIVGDTQSGKNPWLGRTLKILETKKGKKKFENIYCTEYSTTPDF